MNDPFHSRRRRDQICDQFETAWIANNEITIESFLKLHPVEPCSETIAELILLEIDLRYAHGCAPEKDEYLRRFPDASEAIDFGFERLERINATELTSMGMDGDAANYKDLPSIHVDDIPPFLCGFEIIRPVGVGNFGMVFKARNSSGEFFALKFPKRTSVGSLEELEQLLNEAKLAQSVDHPAIVKSFGVQECGGFVFHVQQFVAGPSLAESRPETVREKVELLIPIAHGLAHAHEKELIHRDLKPANILIDPGGQPMIADFGIAIHESAQRRLKGQRCGTPYYMSPEQVHGLKLDGRSDIWALGVILYELLTNRRPFNGATPEEIYDEIKTHHEKPIRMIDPTLDEELQRICLRCLAKAVFHRYHSATELAEDLNNWLKQKERRDTRGFVPLVPRGLRSFGSRDAEAYLPLVPGFRDQFGIPDSIRFWKRAIENEQGTGGIAIGAMIGPSGCGKTSFAKAGVLPRLDPNLVTACYVEANASQTEARLINSLRRLSPEIPDDISLRNLLDGLKNGIWEIQGRKVVIVLDQFEEWLATHPLNKNLELVDALQQCDGNKLCCIFLVRNEYWPEAARLFAVLGAPWSEESTVQRIDFFERQHAINVLYQLGRAFGNLPDEQSGLAKTESRFLEKAIEKLADNGRIACAHLTLFAEVHRNKSWVASKLNRFNGLVDIVERYLEQICDFMTSESGDPEVGLATRNILELMASSSERDLCVPSIDRQSLRKVAQQLDEARFGWVLDRLDQQFRVITRINTRGHDEIEKWGFHSEEDCFFQLSHAYLIEPIKDWLNRKNRESWRGRAKLKLAQLAALWKDDEDSRYLPSQLDFLRIKFGVHDHRQSELEKGFVASATKYYTLRVLVLIFVVIVIGLFVWRVHQDRMRTLGMVAKQLSNFETSDPAIASGKLEELMEYRDWIPQILQQDLSYRKSDARIALVLNRLFGVGRDRVDFLVRELRDCKDLMEFQFILQELTRSPEIALESLNDAIRETKDTRKRVRLAIMQFYLGENSLLNEILLNRSHPSEATLLEHQLSEWLPNLETVVNSLKEDLIDDDLHFGLLVAASQTDLDAWTEADRAWWTSHLKTQYKHNPSAGIHAMCKYLLLHWEIDLPYLPPQPIPSCGFDWWEVEVLPGYFQTFVRINAAKLVRSQSGLRMRTRVRGFFEPGSSTTIDYDFWIADSETRFELARRWFTSRNPDAIDGNLNPDESQSGTWKVAEKLAEMPAAKGLLASGHSLPAFGLTFLETQSLVDWLNEEVRNNALPAFRNGFEFGLPSEVEAQIALRGQSLDCFPFGDESVRDYLDRYAVVASETADRNDYTSIVQAPYSRLPNRNGLFDVLGNVGEFVRTTPRERKIAPKKTDGICFYSGGSAIDQKTCIVSYLEGTAPDSTFLACVGSRLVLVDQCRAHCRKQESLTLENHE